LLVYRSNALAKVQVEIINELIDRQNEEIQKVFINYERNKDVRTLVLGLQTLDLLALRDSNNNNNNNNGKDDENENDGNQVDEEEDEEVDEVSIERVLLLLLLLLFILGGCRSC
jgi:coenzyme F420-reducing hydrogenase alpha subunit